MKLPDEFTSKLRRGFFEMMKIKSIGLKKISVLRKQMNIENIEALLMPVMKTGYLLKGFGKKTQNKIC